VGTFVAVVGQEVTELRFPGDADGNSLELAFVKFSNPKTNEEVISWLELELMGW
jgi:hypothetical protein